MHQFGQPRRSYIDEGNWDIFQIEVVYMQSVSPESAERGPFLIYERERIGGERKHSINSVHWEKPKQKQ